MGQKPGFYMKNPGVYKIVNVVTGQEYYGSSKNMHKRKGNTLID